MKNKYFYSVLLAIACGFWLGGCDVAYKYDIESGTDDYMSDTADVTVDTLAGVDVSMYAQARIFPGLVDTLADQTVDNVEITLDLSRQKVNEDVLGLTKMPAKVYSTGLFAGAGELITVNIDQEIMGLSVQIGCHTADLSNDAAFSREPIVYTRKALFPGKNTIRNPLGGQIWIVKQSTQAGPADFKISISGAYKAPDYILGKTNPQEWAEEVNRTTVPWMELRGNHIAFSVPRERIAEKLRVNPGFAGQLEEILESWDWVMEECYYKFNGLTASAQEDKFRAPDFPQRVVLDAQLPGNVYLLTTMDQAVMALNTGYMIDELLDLDKMRQGANVVLVNALNTNFGVSTGHPANLWCTFMNKTWEYTIVNNALAALPRYRLSEKAFKEGKINAVGAIFTGTGASVSEQFPKALKYAAADSSKLLGSDSGTYGAYGAAYCLLPVLQLGAFEKEDSGWDFYTSLNTTARTSHFTNVMGKNDYFFKALCDYFGTNFGPFFDQWGLELGDDVRTGAYQYPLLNKEVWKYSPLVARPASNVGTYDGTNYHYRHDRSNWVAEAFDKDYKSNNKEGSTSDPELYYASRMFDGDKSTGWCSDDTADKEPKQPYYIVIDMQNEITADGFYVCTRNKWLAVQHLILQTTDETDVSIEDSQVAWKNIYEIEGAGFRTNLLNERFFDFGTLRTFRYLRLVIPDVSHIEKSDDGTIKDNQNPGRRHRIDEFGTFYYKH